MSDGAPREAWVTRDEAMVLTGLSMRALYRRIAEQSWRARPSATMSQNGKSVPEIAVSSLPHAAQALYWSKHLVPAAEPESDPLNLSEIPDPLRVEARRRLAILEQVEPILAQPRGVRRAALAQFCQDRDLSVATVYKWREAYRGRGLGALLPKWGKTRGTFLRLSDALRDFITQEHCSPERPCRTTLYRHVRSFGEAIGEPIPCQATVNRFLNTLAPPAVILAREGPQAWRAQCEPKCERDLSSLLVGEWWVSDHREFDVFVQAPWWNGVTREMEYKLFRPWLTAWLDLRSRVLTGWVVNMVPNSDTIACALRDGIMKRGLPAHLYRDRGKDYKCNWWGGKYSTQRHVRLSDDAMLLLKPGAVSPQGIQLHAAIAYTPWSKPIESWFGHTFPVWERTLPGWCGSDNTARPEKLAREIAQRELLTLEEFTARVGEVIDAYNRTAHSSLDGATPESLWQGHAIERPNPRTLDLLMMKHKPVTVTHQGIKLFGRCYWDDDLSLRMGMQVSVRYSPADVGTLVVFDPATHQFLCEAVNQPALRMGASEADLQALARRKKRAKEAAQAYLSHQRVLRDPDRELAAIAGQRRALKVVALPPRDPSPAAGTLPVTRLLPALDTVAQQIDRQPAAEASAAPTGAPAPSRRGRRSDQPPAFGQAAGSAGTTQSKDLSREALMQELVG